MLERALCSSEEPEVSTSSAVGNQSDSLLQIDQGFHEGGEGIVPLDSIVSNILVHSASSGSPVTPVNFYPEVLDFGQLSPSSTIVNELSESELEDGCLNKSESQDSGLQSENVSFSDTVAPAAPPVVSHDVDGTTQCTDSLVEGATSHTVGTEKDIKKIVTKVDKNFSIKSTGKEGKDICDVVNSCGNTELSSDMVSEKTLVESCIHIDETSEVRHLCRDIVDEIVINAVHDSEGACDNKTENSAVVTGDSIAENTVEVNDHENEKSDVDAHLNAVVHGVNRQFSWQYNVQFALPQLSLTDHDSADRQSSGSFSSDSTISEDAGQQASVSDFVLETLANMNKSRDSNSVKDDPAQTSSSSLTSKQSQSSKVSQQLTSVSHTSSTSHKPRKHDHQSDCTKAQASSEHQSTLDKPSNCAHKHMQDKRDSVENISCGIGANAKTAENENVRTKVSAESKAVQTVKSEETASCSSGQSSAGSDSECDTQW